MSAAVAPVEGRHPVAPARETVARRAVHDEGVEVAVVVEVEERRSVAVGVENVVAGAVAVDVEEREAGLGRDV